MRSKRRKEQVERRRPVVEPNLVGESKTRSAAAPKGLLALVKRFLTDRR